MIGSNMYEAIRPLRYKRIAAIWCKEYRGYMKSLCLTMAIRLIKYCDHRKLSNSAECLYVAKQQLERYMARLAG